MSKFCCEAFASEVFNRNNHASRGHLEEDEDGTWNVSGCCGGGCYVLTEVKFCPFCGTELTKT